MKWEIGHEINANCESEISADNIDCVFKEMLEL